MKPYWESDAGKIYHGHVLNVLKELQDESVHMCVTSPPYWGLRDYGIESQIWDGDPDCLHVWGDENKSYQRIRNGDKGGLHEGRETNKAEKNIMLNPSQGQFCQLCNAWRGSLGLEPTPELFIKHQIQIFREVRRILRSDGTLFLNIGDSYCSQGGPQVKDTIGPDNAQNGAWSGKSRNGINGMKPKDLVGIPWMLAFALRADGWWLRSGIPWVKRSAMPESCQDRPASALEHVFLLTKSQKYFFDMDAIKIKASADSHRRYARGRSNNHKWSDGGPGNQSIAKSFKHMRGVTPKSAQAGSGIKANESFHAAAGDLVGSRNFRNTDLFYQSIQPPHGAIFCGDELVGLDINPQAEKAAHFACFPEKIPEVAILAGTSEKGCCPECGAPWERVTDVTYKNDTTKSGQPAKGNHTHNEKMVMKFSSGERTRRISKTIGWKPGCECGKDPIPCTVLDPFLGSGKTFLVSYKHGRKCIGIELSKTYLDEIAIPKIEAETRQLKLFV